MHFPHFTPSNAQGRNYSRAAVDHAEASNLLVRSPFPGFEWAASATRARDTIIRRGDMFQRRCNHDRLEMYPVRELKFILEVIGVVVFLFVCWLCALLAGLTVYKRHPCRLQTPLQGKCIRPPVQIIRIATRAAHTASHHPVGSLSRVGGKSSLFRL
jgi:hypothetical protein